MSEQSTTSRGRKPTHRLFRVDGQGESATWTPIGAAWPNRDGQGFNISCEDVASLKGRLVLRLTAKDTLKEGLP
jgi:hypothetical protein